MLILWNSSNTAPGKDRTKQSYKLILLKDIDKKI